MLMPKLKKNPSATSVNPKKKVTHITCASCGENKKVADFYVSFNPVHQTSRLPYCKVCLKKMICDTDGNVALGKLKETLRLIDRPFLYDIWKVSLESNGDVFGNYMKNLAMTQYRHLGWSDSKALPDGNIEINYEHSFEDRPAFKITEEVIDRWGANYESIEYESFERKYRMLKNNYLEKTAMHTEALLNYIRYQVKQEMATAANNVGEAKSWGALANSAAIAAKINPSQLSKSDLTDGLSTFGELVRATEQAVDIIEILPQFKEKPQDKVDFTLWCYINYIRDLKGLPPCEYKDIYQFYEERKKEYDKSEFANNNEDLQANNLNDEMI